jgi:hypothetical protein
MVFLCYQNSAITAIFCQSIVRISTYPTSYIHKTGQCEVLPCEKSLIMDRYAQENFFFAQVHTILLLSTSYF